MIRGLTALVTAVGLLSGLAGCGLPPRPAQQAVPGPVGPTLPLRPKETPVAGVDPCTLVPAAVLRELDLLTRPQVVQTPVPGARACGWSRDIQRRPSADLAVGVARQNTADFLGERGATQLSVAGFGAVDVPNNLAGTQHSCDLKIDAAPNQALLVSYYNTLADEPGATHELMCQRARTAAEGIMRNLLASTR